MGNIDIPTWCIASRRVLDISSTNLEEIPEAIGSCTALEELNISSNPISPATLPRSLGELAALRVLVADDAGLSSLPIDLLGLHELKTLSIRRNNLSHLPSWLHHLTKLERLCIEDNPLQGPWKKILAPLLPQAPPITAVPRTPSGLGLPFSPERSAFPMATYISTPSILSPTSSFGATTATTVTPVDSLASPGVLRHHPSAVSSPAEAPISPTMRRMRSTNDLSSPTAGDRIGLTRSPASFSTLQEGSGNTTSSPPKEQDADGVLERLRRAALIEPENYSDSTHSHSRSSHRTRRPGTADGQSLRRPTTADANAGSKWGFIRKMGRKSSSNKMAALAKDQAAAEDLDASMNAAHRLPRQHKAQEIDEKPLRSQEKAPNSAFVPPPSMKPVLESPIMLAPLSPNLERPATNRMSKRKSFLPLELASAPPLLGKVVEDDSAEHSRRLRALMHYMRDLDDLGPSHGSKPGTPPVVDSRPQSRGGTVRGIRDQPSLETLSAAIRNLQMTRDASSASLDSSVLSTLSNTSGGSGAGNDVSTMPESPQAETTQSGPGLKYKDDATRRRRIIAEIVQTEETYIRGLSELIDIYVRPATMPVDGGSGPPVVPPVEHKTVFGNVEGLLQFHAGAFLPSLKTATAPLLQRDAVHGDADEAEETALTASVAEEVAGVFTHHAAFFRMYSAYVNNCDAAQTRISQWLTPSANTAAAALKSATSGSGGSSAHAEASGGLTAGQKKKLKQYIKRCRLHPKHSQLTLESYLLLPVQRIPRYRLLLEDLVRSTPPTRLREPESLSLALEHISNIASSVNESKRQSEQDRKLLGWQTRIRGRWPSPLVQPHRRLIKDGTLVLKRVVKRTPAFLSQNAQNGEDVAQDGASATVGSVIQVDCLQQQSMDKPVNILLCNDITVVVTNPPHARDEHPTVDLYAVLRVQAAKPAQVMGGSNLRVVDAKNILYFAAKSPAEAEEWRDAINSQNQE